jgi:hypothetical protein
MAENDTWESIRHFGLLSTTAILDLHNLHGEERLPFESMHRPEMMTVPATAVPAMVLRDQKPMSDTRLAKCLGDGLTPRDWYEILNRKVFFWATEDRLNTLLGARAYRSLTHDVLTIDSAPFLRKYAGRIELCHMNSGNTFPVPHPRGASTFVAIEDYPAKPNGEPIKEVAEVTVTYSVPNIADYVLAVRKMCGPQTTSVIYQR